MRISRWEFEKELDALINAALSAINKETARMYLIQAENKINGYDDIPYDLQQQYRAKINSARSQLGL